MKLLVLISSFLIFFNIYAPQPMNTFAGNETQA